MPTTANIDMPYPDESSDASLNVHIAALAGAIDSRIGPYVLDTGWVEIASLSANVGGNIRYRRAGKVAQVLGNGLTISGNFPAKSITMVAPAGSIPVGVRPAFNVRGSGNGAGSATIILSVLNDGSVYVFNQHTAAVTSMDGAVMYLTD